MSPTDCPGCKLTRLFRWYLKWDTNGTIVIRLDPRQRVALVESELLDDVYRRIEERVGLPIGRIVFEAERAAAKATMDALLPRRPDRLVRNRLVMHPVSRFFQLVARIAGLGDFKTVFYHVYEGSLARARNPVNRDILAAMVVGAFESAEGVVYDHAWVELGGSLYFLIVPSGRKPDIAVRMAPEIVKPLPGSRKLALCPRCGLPEMLGHLRWQYDDALIMDTRRDVRMSFIDGYAFSAVFRELIAELGDDIVPVIVDASREYARRGIEDTGFLDEAAGRDESYCRFLDLLPLYGHGNPVGRELSTDALSVTIENPYSVHLLAGQLLAIYEVLEKREGSVAIDGFAPQKVRITVTPGG